MPPIDDRAQWNNNYLSGSADWVSFETTVSTSSGQIALAPGYLQRKWTKDGRNYFEYKSEAKLLPFFSWLSADWQVRRDRWNDVALEVYYDAKHPYNVDRMIESRSEAHTSELQYLMRISYAVFCLKKKKKTYTHCRIYFSCH